VPDDLTRVVVGMDPPVTSHKDSDECGIIVAGVRAVGPLKDWQAWVIADYSTGGTPQHWAETAARAYHDHAADRLIAEVNQGGDIIEVLMRQVSGSIAYRAVYATKGKHIRAEPIAALYEQGRVHHGAVLDVLERQMCEFTGRGGSSPDRLDALVWALTDLIVAADDNSGTGPRVRGLD
jgi:phage terminase large subunit-like protein